MIRRPPRSTRTYTLFPYTTLFRSAQNAVDKALEIDPDETYTSLNGSYEGLPIAVSSFTDNAETIITNIQSASNDGKKDALQSGAAASLFLKGEKRKLFDEYYTSNSGIFGFCFNGICYTDPAEDIAEEINLAPTTTFTTANIIKIIGTDAQLKDYLDEMYTLAQTWNISKNSDAQPIYAKWENDDSNKSGMLAMASMYNDLGQIEDAKKVLAFSKSKVFAFTDMTYKTTALIAMINAINEIGIEDETFKSEILTELKTSALEESTSIGKKIQAANILSANNEKTNALAIVNSAYASIETLNSGDITNIQDRTEFLVGLYEDSRGNAYDSEDEEHFTNSIANGYFQAGNITKAKEIIAEAYNGIKTLEATATQYDLLVNIVKAYGSLNDLEALSPIIDEIKTTEENEFARVEAAKALAQYDAFIGNDIASIDSDGDGNPDFFNINVSQEQIDSSELTLDEDIDNDTIVDTQDTLPYDKI